MKIGFVNVSRERQLLGNRAAGSWAYPRRLADGLEQAGHDVEIVCEGYKDGKEKWPFDLDYDLIIYGEGIPRELAGADRWWQDPIRQASCPIFVALHTTFWSKNQEPWAREVRDEIDLLLVPHEPIQRRVEATEGWNWRMVRLPVVLDDDDREKMTTDWDYPVMSCTRMEDRKRPRVLAEVSDQIEGEIVFHNTGPNEDQVKELASDNCTFLGVTSRERLDKTFYRSLTMVDFDGKPRSSRDYHDWRHVTNYTMMEPMKYGTIPIFDGRYMNEIFEGHAVPAYGKEEIPDAVAEVEGWSESELRARQEKNYDFLEETFEATKIAEQVVEYAKNADDLDKPNSLDQFM